jgi:signal peptidase I
MESRRRRRWPWRLLPILMPILGMALWYASDTVAYAANLRLYFIPSGSMAPALAPGDRITVDRRGGDPRRGEIWVFRDPAGGAIVKRVIGLPGETVRVSAGRVQIDGRPLDEPYLASPMTYEMPPVRLGPDQYLVLGDRRDASQDSHVWGPLPKNQFIGRAEHRYRPGVGIGGLP